MTAASELKAIRNPHTRAVLEALLRQSGISGALARGYLVARMRWHLGLRNAHVTPPSAALKPAELEHVETRAYELLDEHRHLLPALQNEGAARHDAGPTQPTLAQAAGAGIPEHADHPNVTPITAARSARR